MIPISRPSVGVDELAEVLKVFESGWLGMGSTVFEFEKAVKGYLGAKHVIAVNTGTSAMHIALDALALTEGDEVVVPSLTFAATIQAIVACRARPVFCDIEADTLNMDLSDLARKISKKTRVIFPVHYGGLPCDMNGILKLAGEHGLRVLEDAAHAFGSTDKGRKIGSFGDIQAFSFDPIKALTCGEGGAVTLSDDALAQQIMRKRILGIDKDTWNRYRSPNTWYYEVTTTGWRYHMSNINAAIGLVQLGKLEGFLKRRRELVRAYDDALRGISGLEMLRRDYEGTAPFNYIVKVKDGKRDDLLEYLTKNGVGAGVHYIPNHIQPVFRDFQTELPVTEKVWKEILSLPLFAVMSQADFDKVIATIRAYFER